MSEKNVIRQAFDVEVGKILQLMVHSLYTNKDIFLRELISNASDACDKLRYEALTKPELMSEGELKITVKADKKAGAITIQDNGIGMSKKELTRNLGTIARSGTQEFLKKLSGDKGADTSLIGQFGVGFYSAFMVADKVTVISKKAGEKKAHSWESEGEGEFEVADAEADFAHGTQITVHLRKEENEYLDAFRLKHIVSTYSDHIPFPIALIGEEGKEETVNKASALWMRSKNDITPEQYQEFYRHVAHQPDDPWLTLHHHAEGKMEYTSLLFIPSIRPFDLFHPDRKRRVKLYVKRVYITEEGELIPHYLRFLRGVVDSEDLPLNISRETLQANPIMPKMRDALTKKVLAELKKKMHDDAEGYATFWKNFGAVVKEGLCEAGSPREQIMECALFNSALGEKPESLDNYIKLMPASQEHIYYLTGDRLETLKQNPKLEGFTKRGIDVLLFTDHVDDFWVNVVPNYKGKTLKSITRADIDLNAIKPLEEEKKAEEAAPKEGMDKLIATIKVILGEYVKDVRTTSKLSNTPVCLSVDEGAMDIRLERFLIEQKQLATAAAKILEINPEHPVIRSLAGKADDSKAIEDVIWLLFDQARIVEGEEVTNPAEFSRRLNLFVQKSLAA